MGLFNKIFGAKQVVITLNTDGFYINNQKMTFPLEAKLLEKELGKAKVVTKKEWENTWYVWDKLGIRALSKDSEHIETLLLEYKTREHIAHFPKNNFNGEFMIENSNVLEYRKNNKNKLVKLYEHDDGKAFILSDMACWFDMDKAKIETIQFEKFKGNIYDSEITKPRKTSIQIDKKYNYLIPLWEAWKDEILKIVSSDNEYFNIKYGVTKEELEKYKTLQSIFDENLQVTIPDELLAFYSIYDVKHNVITSAFSFKTDSYEYDLIPFNKIQEEWNMTLEQNEDHDLDEIGEKYSDKINITDYTNPAWIPFAEGKNGDYLLYDTAPTSIGSYGQIIELENDSWKRTIITDSLSQLLQSEIQKIKNKDNDKINSFELILKNN